MTKQELFNIIQNERGYIYRKEGSTTATLYNSNRQSLCKLPAATVERIAELRDVQRWEEYNGEFIGDYRCGEYEEHRNNEHVKSISDDLDKYVDGIVHRCPDCDSTIEIPETVGDKFKCPCCGEVHEIEEFEQLSLYDYFGGDVLDIDYLVNYQKEYKGARILVAWGGPNIYIDTISGNVELYWWTESAKHRMRSDVIDAIDEWAEEYFNCL